MTGIKELKLGKVKLTKIAGWLLLVIAAVAAIPAIGHVLAFGLLVIKLVAELAVIAALVPLGIWLVRR